MTRERRSKGGLGRQLGGACNWGQLVQVVGFVEGGRRGHARRESE